MLIDFDVRDRVGYVLRRSGIEHDRFICRAGLHPATGIPVHFKSAITFDRSTLQGETVVGIAKQVTRPMR